MKLTMQELHGCEICAALFSEPKKAIRLRDPFSVSDEEFTLHECAGCGTWVLNPRPVASEMVQFYDADFVLDVESKQRSLLGRLSLFLRDRVLFSSEVNWLSHHLKVGARYLDYSAGDGKMIALLQESREDVAIYATEFSPLYRERLGTLLPGDCIRSDLDDWAREARFDTISAFGVLEHVCSPRDLVAAFHSRLEPGGKVVVTIPNPDSFQRHLSGANWIGWLAPRHMHLMKMRTIAALFKDEGFDILERRSFLPRYCVANLIVSLCPSLNPSKVSGLRLLISGVLFCVAYPLEWFASLFKRSGFMGLVAVKKT